MTVFEIHTEGGFAAAEAFLDGWLPEANASLARLLGLPDPPDVIHVFLSDRATHEQRFPRRESEQFLNAGGDQPVQDIPLRVESYALGVAHLTEQGLGLPPGVPMGEPAIFLDCETLAQLAEEIELEFEPVLGRTAIHELSHIVRGHVTPDGARTHGFAREGDAQRDAWAVTASMLASPATRPTALAGRAAQVRLANRQPRAYTMFGHDSADRYRWQSEDPKISLHVVRTPRNLLAVVKEDIVVLPVRTVLKPVPEVGDLVYLAEQRSDRDFFVVGPWVVLNREQEAVVLVDRDRHAVSAAEAEDRSRRHIFEYLLLRPSTLKAARAIPRTDMPPMGLIYSAQEPGESLNHLEDSAEGVFEEVREERRRDDVATWESLLADGWRDTREADEVFDPEAE